VVMEEAGGGWAGQARPLPACSFFLGNVRITKSAIMREPVLATSSPHNQGGVHVPSVRRLVCLRVRMATAFARRKVNHRYQAAAPGKRPASAVEVQDEKAMR